VLQTYSLLPDARVESYRYVQLVRWDMSYDLGWCSTHFSGENLKATAHVSANELYIELLRDSFRKEVSYKTIYINVTA
jgi:hypothetical protein